MPTHRSSPPPSDTLNHAYSRRPDDGHLMGFEIWEASKILPAELIAALPLAGSPTASAA